MKKRKKQSILEKVDNLSDEEFLEQLPSLKRKAKVMSISGITFAFIFILLLILVAPYL